MNGKRWMCLAAIWMTCGAALAQTGGGGVLGVTAKIGTLGYGGDLTLGLAPRLNLRAGYCQAQFTGNVSLEEADVDGEADLQTIPVLLDVHPFGGGFRVSGGYVKNSNKVKMSVSPGTVLNLDGADYQVESLDGSITFDENSWYAGIGYGNAVSKDGRWSFACDFGVMFHGEPVIAATLNASDPAIQSLAQNALQAEVVKKQDDIKDFKYYPVISVGVSYQF